MSWVFIAAFFFVTSISEFPLVVFMRYQMWLWRGSRRGRNRHACPISLESDPEDDTMFIWVNRESRLTGVWIMGKKETPSDLSPFPHLRAKSKTQTHAADSAVASSSVSLNHLYLFIFPPPPDNGLNSQKGIPLSRLWKVRYFTLLHFSIIFIFRSLLDQSGCHYLDISLLFCSFKFAFRLFSSDL